jgi:hypothetical protein
MLIGTIFLIYSHKIHGVTLCIVTWDILHKLHDLQKEEMPFSMKQLVLIQSDNSTSKPKQFKTNICLTQQ